MKPELHAIYSHPDKTARRCVSVDPPLFIVVEPPVISRIASHVMAGACAFAAIAITPIVIVEILTHIIK